MVVQSDPEVRAYVPQAPSRVVVAADGSLAAIYDAPRLVVVELPSCAIRTDVAMDPQAETIDVAWVGPVPRLVVLFRYASHSALQLIDSVGSAGARSTPAEGVRSRIDSHGARTVAEIRLETPMRLVAAVGAHVLAVGPLGTAVLSAGEAHLTPYQFPARSLPVAAGSAGGQFVVALSASIEEWDPQTRMPKRRLKLPAPTTIAAVGGSDRTVWMTTPQEPTKIDVFAMVNRGQPKRHVLPEPIAHVSGHPRSDLLVCRGAESHKLYVVDLDGKSALRTIDVPGIDCAQADGLVVGRSVGVLVAQAGRPLAIAALGSRDVEASESRPQTSPVSRPPTNGLGKRSTLYGDDDSEPHDDELSEPPPQLAATPAADAAATQRTAALAAQVSAWRGRVSTGNFPSIEVSSRGWPGQHSTWRDDLAAWSRTVGFGETVPACPNPPQIGAMLERFALKSELGPALSLLYGCHLCGQLGAAPIDIARVLGRNWDEALGNGQLDASRVALYLESRVRLAGSVERALDGLPPRMGTLVGQSGPVHLLGPCVVVDAGDDLAAVAQTWLDSVGGAILASDELEVTPDLPLEARAYGAVAMVRCAAVQPGGLASDVPLLIVVGDEASAEAMGLPRL